MGTGLRTLEEVQEVLAYHPATPDVAPRFAAIRRLAYSLAEESWDLIPDGPEKTLAMRGIQNFMLHANAAIALTTPADLTTPEVARVFPGEDGPHGPTSGKGA
jgi:hypothetical protein